MSSKEEQAIALRSIDIYVVICLRNAMDPGLILVLVEIWVKNGPKLGQNWAKIGPFLGQFGCQNWVIIYRYSGFGPKMRVLRL